jgi:hypothetical protein
VSSGMSQAEELVTFADLAEVFRGPDGQTAFASVDTNGHQETWPVKSAGFKRWLRGQFYLSKQKPPGGQAFADALEVIDARALYSSTVLPVHTRVATEGAAIYLDLANTQWQAIQITADGWQVVDRAPVKFRRSRGMLPLPVPTAGGSVEDLRAFVNVKDEAQWRLLIGWLLATLRGVGPFPVLALGGEQGSAKSTTAKALRSMVDPNQAPLRAEPRDVQDIMISARHGWIVALDNLSSIEDWLSDCLCRLATGGGFSTRKLYSDDDEIIFDAKRPVTINGIEEVIERGDLLDRAILLDLPVIDETRRLSEREFWAAFDLARPRLLGALLTAVSAGLARETTVKLGRLPRMADFCIQVTAAAAALGWADDDFITAYAANRAGAHESVLDASPVAGAIRALVASGPWSGTASELLPVLTAHVTEVARKERWWPKTAKGLAGALRRLAPNLRAVGVEIQFEREAGGVRRRLITIQTARGSDRPNGPDSPTDQADRPGDRPADGTGNGRNRDGRDEWDGRDAPIPVLSGRGPDDEEATL